MVVTENSGSDLASLKAQVPAGRMAEFISIPHDPANSKHDIGRMEVTLPF